MTSTDGTLYHALSQVPDHRHARGRSYTLAALLTYTATAILCGARSLYAIAQWGRDYNHLARSSGSPAGGPTTPTGPRPSANSTPSSPGSTWPGSRRR